MFKNYDHCFNIVVEWFDYTFITYKTLNEKKLMQDYIDISILKGNKMSLVNEGNLKLLPYQLF